MGGASDREGGGAPRGESSSPRTAAYQRDEGGAQLSRCTEPDRGDLLLLVMKCIQIQDPPHLNGSPQSGSDRRPPEDAAHCTAGGRAWTHREDITEPFGDVRAAAQRKWDMA